MSVNVTNEYFKFVLAKRALEDKLLAKEDEALNEFALQGHIIPPGMVAESIGDFEVEKRIDLEVKDAAIIQVSIDIELEQLDLLYKQQIATAEIAYSAQETALLDSFNEEVAAIMYGYNLQEENLALAALQIEEMELILISSKTAIALEKETLHQQMLNMDVTLLPYQITLINARTAVIAKKLEVIPYLQQLVALESQLIEYVAITLGYEQTLEATKKQLIEAKTALLPLLNDLATKKKALATAEEIETGNLIAIAQIDSQKADLEIKKTDAFVTLQQAEGQIESIRRQIISIRSQINSLRERDVIDSMRLRSDTDLQNANTTVDYTNQVLDNHYRARMISEEQRVSSHFDLTEEHKVVHAHDTQNKISFKRFKDDLDKTYVIQTTDAEIRSKMMSKFIQYVME